MGAGFLELFTVYFNSKRGLIQVTVLSQSIWALMGANPAQAEESFAAITGKPVVITAARMEQSLEEVLGDVTVITAEDIRLSGAQNLLDALRSVPGVQLTLNGGPQQTSGVFIRGAETRHTLLLVDGMRVGSTDGLTNTQIQMVPLDQIERIEVLKGAGSALYGADAIGGVVQVITKKGQKGLGGQVQAGLGSNSTRQISTSVSLGNDSTTIRVGAGYQETKGYSSLKNPSLPGQRDDDGFRKSSGSLVVNHQLNSQHQLGFTALVSDLNNQFDSAFSPDLPYFNRNVQSVYGLNSRHQWNSDWSTRFQLSSTEEEVDLPLGFPLENKSHQTQFQAMNEVKVAGGKALVGFEHLNQGFEQFSGGRAVIFPFGRRNTDSALLGYLGQAGALTYQANLRQDNDSQYSGATTGQLSGEYKWSSQWSTGASAGTGFKAPGTQQVVGFGGRNSLNLGLQPEESTNYEVYSKVQGAGYTNRTTVFVNDIKNLITFNFNTSGYFNQGQVEILGLSSDTAVNWKYGRWGGDVQLLSAQDNTGQQAIRRARRTARLFADTTWGAWTGRAEVLASSQRRDVGNTTLGGYGLLNLSAVYRVSKSDEIGLRWENVLDKDYEYAAGYNVARQDVLVSYRKSF